MRPWEAARQRQLDRNHQRERRRQKKIGRAVVPVALLASLSLAFTASAEAPEADPLPDGCDAYTGAEHRQLVRSAFRGLRVSRGARKDHAEMLRCARSPEQRATWRRGWRAAKRALTRRRVRRRHLDAVTPPGMATLDAIAACESGGDPTAVSDSGTYRGKYQFDYGTWASVGGSGDPAAAPEREQDRRAAQLYRERGSQPWPVCG